MTPRTIQLFLTPQAGARLRKRARHLARALESQGVEVLPTPDAVHPLTIDERADQVCAIGGDGTLRYVVDAVRKRDRAVPVSVFPAGTINLVARELDQPATAAAFAARLIADRRPSPGHFALVGDLPLLACASVGPDSYVVERVSTRLKRLIGRAAYGVAFMCVLVDWPRVRIAVRHAGGRIACEAVYVAKGRFYAGPWSFAPEAALRAPILHVVTLEHASRWMFCRFAWRLVRGLPIDRLQGVRHFTCTELEIEGDGNVPLQADGDIFCRLPASIRMAPTPLEIL